MWQGSLLEIHTTAAARQPMVSQFRAILIAGEGLKDDRYALGTGISPFPDIREVKLIEIETIEALARDHGVTLSTAEHRRNLTTQSVPLNHLVGKRFWVGGVLLEGGRLNTPCKYLDLMTGKAVCDLLEHRSGLNCRILRGGAIGVGDLIRPDPDP